MLEGLHGGRGQVIEVGAPFEPGGGGARVRRDPGVDRDGRRSYEGGPAEPGLRLGGGQHRGARLHLRLDALTADDRECRGVEGRGLVGVMDVRGWYAGSAGIRAAVAPLDRPLARCAVRRVEGHRLRRVSDDGVARQPRGTRRSRGGPVTRPR